MAYLLVYSLASLRRGKPLASVPARACKRFAVLIAAYREDAVILSTVHACLAQDYPDDKYDVTVISDHMRPETNAALSSLPIKLLQVDFEKSTNTKSLKAALEYLDKAAYDVALIIDADNIIAPSYLSEVNDAFAVPGVRVVQTHRVAKNLNTDMAYLDAVSEEINNSIFRSGHANLGMSAALIGSGMAFDYPLFYDAMMSNTSVGGFDRVLEMKLLYEGVHFHYLPDTFVKDEKIQQANNFYQQRRRWLSAQYYSFFEFAGRLLPAIRDGKWDFCDKLYQQISFSRVLLLGVAYKQDIDDYRESPAFRVMEHLHYSGAVVDYYDPWVPECPYKGRVYHSIPELTAQALEEYDLVMITTAHSNVDYALVQQHAKSVFDTKNVMKDITPRDNIEVL